MAETIEDRGSGMTWHWDNVQADLKRVGLTDIHIDPLSVRPNACGGEHDGIRFWLTWVPDRFALLSMKERDNALIAALERVLGYAPLCSYVAPSGLPTVEWDCIDPAARLAGLRAQGREIHVIASTASPLPHRQGVDR